MHQTHFCKKGVKYKEKFPNLDITKDIDLAEEYISGSITQPESI